MSYYRIRYETDVEADSPAEAAVLGWDVICDVVADPEAFPPVIDVAPEEGASSFQSFEVLDGQAVRWPPKGGVW